MTKGTLKYDRETWNLEERNTKEQEENQMRFVGLSPGCYSTRSPPIYSCWKEFFWNIISETENN